MNEVAFFAGENWIPVRDGDDRARALYLRHYSARKYRDGRPRRKFVGPGEYIVLITIKCDALFIWRKFISGDNQSGVNCACFRNEGEILSSDLINEACELAWIRWPGERLYTYVADAKVKSVNPGYCFKQAGWRFCSRNKSGKLSILEILPSSG